MPEKHWSKEEIEQLVSALEGFPYRSPLGADLIQIIRQLLAERTEDSKRLEFVISTLNEWDSFGDWCETWHPTLRTSRVDATDEEWRKRIDEARGLQDRLRTVATAMKGEG